MSKNIGVINRTKFILGSEELCTLYYTLVLPYMQYCSIIWGINYKARLDGIVKLQKKILRIIAKVGYRDHTSECFKLYKILKFEDLVYYQIAIFMYQIYNKSIRSTTLCNYFTVVNSHHDHGTRSSNQFYCNFARTAIRQNTILVKGPKIWKEIDNYIKDSKSLAYFKSELKKLLLDKY